MQDKPSHRRRIATRGYWTTRRSPRGGRLGRIIIKNSMK
jgi:hypothetical protein